jgi:ribosome small subunit-dependent GTPase A
MAHMYRDIGYECIGISAQTGKNIEQVKARLEGKTAMVLGHSGAGKSTLINRLSPSLQLKTQPLSEQHAQGQHTTTFAQMYDLDFGARIIDTPGIKGLGVVDFEREEIADYFPEFFALKHLCKFHNCMHLNEPQCAVKQALDEDKLYWSRYKSYLQLLEGDDTYREGEK